MQLDSSRGSGQDGTGTAKQGEGLKTDKALPNPRHLCKGAPALCDIQISPQFSKDKVDQVRPWVPDTWPLLTMGELGQCMSLRVGRGQLACGHCG